LKEKNLEVSLKIASSWNFSKEKKIFPRAKRIKMVALIKFLKEQLFGGKGD